MESRSVHLIGGIFGQTEEFRRAKLTATTETHLRDGLQELGWVVSTAAHELRPKRWSSADLVHIHHLANSCVRLSLPLMGPRRPKIVFTRHATKAIPIHQRYVLRKTYDAADAVVVLSKAEARLTMRDVPASKVHIIYNGIDGTKFDFVDRGRPGKPADPWHLLYIGQLIELKRVHIFIRLIAMLRRSGINVVGSIVSQRETMRPELEKLAVDLAVDKYVNFRGALVGERLLQVMASAHALVQPSRTEALSTVVTEAVLTGLPVISFEVGGVKEQLPEKVSVADVEDRDAFEQAALDLLERYEYWCEVYKKNHAHARVRFSLKSMVEKHARLYESLVDCD